MSVEDPFGTAIAGLCEALDEFVATTAQGDPRRAAAALADLGLTRTAALFGAGPPPAGLNPWRRFTTKAGNAP